MNNIDRFRLTTRFEQGSEGFIDIARKPYDFIFLADDKTNRGAVIHHDRDTQAEYLALTAYNIVIGPSAGEVASKFVNVDYPLVFGKRGYYFSAGVARLVYDDKVAGELAAQAKRMKEVKGVLGEKPSPGDASVNYLSSGIMDSVNKKLDQLPRARRSRGGEKLSLASCIARVREIETAVAGEIEPEPVERQVKSFKDDLNHLFNDRSSLYAKVAALEDASTQLKTEINERKADLDRQKRELGSAISRLTEKLRNAQKWKDRFQGFAIGSLVLAAFAGLAAAGGHIYRELPSLQFARSIAILWGVIATGILAVIFGTWAWWREHSPNCTELPNLRRRYLDLRYAATRLRFLENAASAVLQEHAKHEEKVANCERKLNENNSRFDSRGSTDFSIYCTPTREEIEQGISSFPKLLNEHIETCIRELTRRSNPLLQANIAKLGKETGITLRILSIPFSGNSNEENNIKTKIQDRIYSLENSEPTVVDGSQFRIANEIHYLKIQEPIPAFPFQSLNLTKLNMKIDYLLVEYT